MSGVNIGKSSWEVKGNQHQDGRLSMGIVFHFEGNISKPLTFSSITILFYLKVDGKHFQPHITTIW